MSRVFFLLLLVQASPACAFLFWGGAGGKEAASRLEEMRSANDAGDCQGVLAAGDLFLGEKPPRKMREEAYGYIGACYERCGSVDKAINLYKLTTELYPENLTFKSRLAAIYNRTGFPEHAAPLFSEIISARPGDIAATLGFARANAALGFLSRASDAYAKAVAMQDFSDGSALKEYADCLLRKRDWDEAFFVAQKGALLSPLSGTWPRVKARVKAGLGDYAGAVSFMDKAIALSPGRMPVLERALYLMLGGRPEPAMQAADAELKKNPGDPLASLVKGMSLYSVGKKEEAARYLAAASGGGKFTAGIAAALLARGAEKTEALCGK